MTAGNQNKTWAEVISVYSKPRVIAMLFLGFSGGLPFLLVFSTLTAWFLRLDRYYILYQGVLGASG